MNRYSPDTAAITAENPYASLGDSKHYMSLIKNGFMGTSDSHWRYRVLVPYVAKPFYLLAKGNIGSWNPVLFGLLVANSLFIASAAVILFLIGSAVTKSATVGFISSFLLLSNFNISNMYLAGLVDSSELFIMVLTIWLLLQKKWQILPVVAVLAALARETTVVFTACFAAGWFIAEAIKGEYRRHEIYAIIFYGIAALALGSGGLMLLRYAGTSRVIMPWQFEGNMSAIHLANIVTGIWGLMTSKATLYAFIWLLPLGLLGIRAIPQKWLWASIVTLSVALVLIVIMNAGENAGRPLFNAVGPMMSVAAASYITKLFKLDNS